VKARDKPILSAAQENFIQYCNSNLATRWISNNFYLRNCSRKFFWNLMLPKHNLIWNNLYPHIRAQMKNLRNSLFRRTSCDRSVYYCFIKSEVPCKTIFWLYIVPLIRFQGWSITLFMQLYKIARFAEASCLLLGDAKHRNDNFLVYE